MKEIYIEIMDSAFSAYKKEDIIKKINYFEKNGIEEHGFTRLTANLGILIAHGRRTEYKELLHKMMDICTESIPVAVSKKGTNVGNEFSVKEIVLSILELEKAKIFKKSITDIWRKRLSNAKPSELYTVIAQKPPVRIGNFAAFAAASEQIRQFAGLCEQNDFIENQIQSQLLSFDENGMYRDPHEPIVYDLVTRLQLCFALYFGYSGCGKKALEEELLKSADITLKMQSVTGEIPFGGRSNQFLHCDTFFAAIFEFYAQFFKKRGDLENAKKFKSGAKRCVESILPLLAEKEIHHIRNYYPVGSSFGCEVYAYFDKYMITTASWAYLAYVMADDEIEEEIKENPKRYICETSDDFHKVFCNFNDYYIEFDTKADKNYDASGLGRIQKKGFPSTICLAVPFCKNPFYTIDIQNKSEFSICAGVKVGDDYDYTYDVRTKYTLTKKIVDDNHAEIEFLCQTVSGAIVHENIIVSDDGVLLTASSPGSVEILFPAFLFDGSEKSKIDASENTLLVHYKGCVCEYSTNGKIVSKNSVYANRNGHYAAYAVKGENSVVLNIKIYK